MLTHLDISTLNEIYREEKRQPRMFFLLYPMPDMLMRSCQFSDDSILITARILETHFTLWW